MATNPDAVRTDDYADGWPRLPPLPVLLGASPPPPPKSLEIQISEWRTFHEARFKAEVARLTATTDADIHAYVSSPEPGRVPEGVVAGLLISVAVEVAAPDRDGDEAQNALAALAPLSRDPNTAVAAFGAGGRWAAAPSRTSSAKSHLIRQIASHPQNRISSAE